VDVDADVTFVMSCGYENTSGHWQICLNKYLAHFPDHPLTIFPPKKRHIQPSSTRKDRKKG